jgi:hypothetical protein
MQCFNHQNLAAVGVCHSCGKALCAHCALDTGAGLVCHSDWCERRNALVNQSLEANARIMATANRNMRSGGIFSGMIGVVMLIPALLLFKHNPIGGALLAVPGMLFAMYGFSRLARKNLYPTIEHPPAAPEHAHSSEDRR